MTVTTRASTKQQSMTDSAVDNQGTKPDVRKVIISQDPKSKAVTLRTPQGPVSLAVAETLKDEIVVVDYDCIVVSPNALPSWLTALRNVQVAREPDANTAEPLPDIKARTYVGTCLPGTWGDGALLSAQEQYVLALDLATANFGTTFEKGVPHLHTTVLFKTSVEPLLDMHMKKKGPRYPQQLTQWIANVLKTWEKAGEDFSLTIVDVDFLAEVYGSDKETFAAELKKAGCPENKLHAIEFITPAEFRARAGDDVFTMATEQPAWTSLYTQCSIDPK